VSGLCRRNPPATPRVFSTFSSLHPDHPRLPLKDLGFIERKDATYRIAKALQTVRIPSTIQDIILARVDALPEGAKELLQVGSLIEREFSYKLIKAAMHLLEEDLLRRLSSLKDAELLYERGLFPDSAFVFKHALTREVVYDTLLEKKKKEIHLDIGKAIEEVYQENLEEMYSTLVEHFEKGGDYEKAAQYFDLAQGRARLNLAILDAIAFSRKGVACLEKLPSSAEMQKRVIDARVTLAFNCHSLALYVEAKEAISPIFDLTHQLEYRKRLPAIYYFMAVYLFNINEGFNEAEARRYLMEAQRLALEEKDYQSLWLAYNQEGLAHTFNCEFVEGESCYLRNLEMSEAGGFLWGRVIAKTGLAQGVYSPAGRIGEALKCGQEALQLALQAEDLYLKGWAYCGCGVGFFYKGLFPQAEENLTLAIEMNQKTYWVEGLFLSLSILGILHSEMGRYQEAQACFDAGLAVYERARTWPSFARIAQILKVAAGVRGHLNPAIDAVLNFDLQEIKLESAQGTAARAMGEIYLYIDEKHMDEAEIWIRKAIEINEQNRMPWDLARDHALYAEFFKKKGDPSQAKEKLGKAIELMRSCGADGWVKKYEEELAGL
jgi:tetratricopeptide (TPR) repeat protein